MARPTAPHPARHRPRLPGIGALPSPRHTEVGILPPRSGFRLRYFAEKPITGPAPKVRKPRSIASGVFFSPFTRPTVNPGVGTGLPHSILAWAHSILAWAQDCHTQSWRGHRIAPAFPRKRWKRSAAQHYAPRLAARIARKTPAVRRYTETHSRTRRPASLRRIWEVKTKLWERSSFSPRVACDPGFGLVQVRRPRRTHLHT